MPKHNYKAHHHSQTLTPPPNPHSALEHRRSRRSVGLRPGIQVVRDPRVRPLVRTRQTDRSRRLTRTPRSDVDLRTLHVELCTRITASRVQRDQLAAQQVLARRDAGRDSDGLLSLVGDQAVDAPFGAVKGVFGDLCSVNGCRRIRWWWSRTLNQPFPTPESVFASDTFFRYAITGPLWLESMTSLGPEVSVWRQVSVACEPAWTVMTVLVLVVGLGPPLQTMSLDVTSVIGCEVLVKLPKPAWKPR